MRALRLKLRQSSANYKKEETVENKMTYPLPPLSTVIGAIHAACGYKTYHPMDISIQGNYEAMHREPYTDYCFLNSLQDDRGILVKMCNETMLSNAFVQVASAKKSQGNSFRNSITIQVHNQKLLDEYCELKDMYDKISDFKKKRLAPLLEQLKRRKKQLSEKKKHLDKKSTAYDKAMRREKELAEAEKRIKAEMDVFQQEYYQKPISKYRSLTKSLKFYEILDHIQLIIHIKTDEEKDLDDIMEHIYNLKSIGRSEDMVQVEEAVIVQLEEDIVGEVYTPHSAYLDYKLMQEDNIRIIFDHIKQGGYAGGTKYYLNKNYKIVNGKRKFEKKKVLYTSQYAVEQFGDGLYLDRDGDNKYVVNLI